MKFDSHVESLLTAAVSLVNLLTPGHDGTSPVELPTGPRRTAAVGDVLLSQGRRTRVTAADAKRLDVVAGQLREVFTATDRGDLDTTAGLVNALLESTRARPRLDRFDEGWSLHFHGPDDGVVVGWSAGFASALALCVGSEYAGRLGVCEAAPCDRVFVDGSKNGTRRFCSTRCQSRVKAAAHRSRHT